MADSTTLQGSGMRWSEDGFNHLLHLRLAWVNRRFDTLFSDEPLVPALYPPTVRCARLNSPEHAEFEKELSRL